MKRVDSDVGRALRSFWNPERRQNSSLFVTTSWDDGHPADLRVADLLDKHGLNGTFYIPCSNSEGRPVMSSSDVTELARRFEIGGHTQTHISLTQISPSIAANEIRVNKRVRALADWDGAARAAGLQIADLVRTDRDGGAIVITDGRAMEVRTWSGRSISLE